MTDDKWFARVDRLDKLLHSEGVSGAARMLIVATYADALIQADKAKRELKNVDDTQQLCSNGAITPTSTQSLPRNV